MTERKEMLAHILARYGINMDAEACRDLSKYEVSALCRELLAHFCDSLSHARLDGYVAGVRASGGVTF